MIIVAGCLIEKDNKILMVKEAGKEIYAQWNFPAGRVNEHELIVDGAIREVFEETGCKVVLKGVLPIHTACFKNGQTVVRFTFIAEIIHENIQFDRDELLDVKWLDIDEIKKMSKEELRAYDTSIQIIKDYEEEKIYPLELFNNTKHIR